MGFFLGELASLVERQEVHRGGRSMFTNGEWWEVSRPFCHFRAAKVFDAASYDTIAKNFSKLLEPATAEDYELPKFIRGVYEGELILGVNERIAETFSVIFSENVIRTLHKLLGLPFIPRIDAEMHSHQKGSPSGYIHTDYNASWFDESSESHHAFMFPNRLRCDYFTGRAKVASAVPKEYPRAATLIFYLCNDGWTSSDGGETGLYNGAQQTIDTCVSLIPPINNSLLLFRCSPHSYHRFVTNPGRTRNSIVLRLHTTTEFARSSWGVVPRAEMK
jgi:hypothetical protein